MGGVSSTSMPLPLSSSWWDVREDEEDESLNGLQLSNVYVHDTLEVILSYTKLEEILKLTKVCRVWKDLTTRRSFWKLVFVNNNLDWSSVPEIIKENPNAWMVFYAVSKNQILSKNLVWNHSGEEKSAHWAFKTLRNSPGFTTESPPQGIDPLPQDPNFENSTQSTFVTSYEWATQQQKIDLWSIGLTPAVMRTLIPFQFVCSEMIGARFDCGAKYRFHVCLLDKLEQEILDEDLRIGTIVAGMNWLSESITFRIYQDDVELNNVRYLVVTNHGKDSRFWAGHYGPKFSRISVRVKCLEKLDEEPVLEEEHAEPQLPYVRKRVNEQNWGSEY